MTRDATPKTGREELSIDSGSQEPTPIQRGGRDLPEVITKLIGRRLRALREQQRPPLSQERAAKRMGISQPALSALEAGRASPSLATLLRVQLVYGLSSLEEVFGELPTEHVAKAAFLDGEESSDWPPNGTRPL